MKIAKEVKVGVLVTAALVGLFWGLNFLKGRDVFSGVNKYYAIYSQVDGLAPSSDIFLNGVKIGQVQKIEFIKDKSGRILATLRIKNTTYITKNSTARIISSDLLGGKSMEIILDPESELAISGDTLKSDIQITLSDQVMPIKDKVERLVAALDTLAVSINEVLGVGNRNYLNSSFHNLDKTLQNLQSVSKSLDKMVSTDDSKLMKMISNFESISANIKSNNAELSNALKNISAITDSLAKSNLASTINNANHTMMQTSEIMDKINKGEGTLGMLINNDSLYNALEAAAVDLDKLLIDLKANPKRYVQISVFGGGKSKPK